MKHTLVGNTGFVGRNLAAATQFDALYNSTNIAESFGADNGLVVYSGMPCDEAAAAADPAADRKLAEGAMANIERMKPQKLVLISTTSVYTRCAGVYEDSKIEGEGPAYGHNRYLLEGWARQLYPDALIVRLPALFGDGLAKNYIYDLIVQDKEAISRTDSRSVFQFYDLANLWADINRCLKIDILLANFATEPVEAGALYHFLFGEEFENRLEVPPVRCDVRTRYGREFGGHDDYLADRTEVVACIAKFVGRVMANGGLQ